MTKHQEAIAKFVSETPGAQVGRFSKNLYKSFANGVGWNKLKPSDPPTAR